MARHSYIPKTDHGKRDWFLAFASNIQKDPQVYSLSAEDAAAMMTLAMRFVELYIRAQQPTGRTPAGIKAKNSVRREAVKVFRSYAMRIKADPTITPFQRSSLGIHIDKPTKSPVPRPRTQPLLAVEPVNGGHRVRYSDIETPSSRAKPDDVAALELYVAVGKRSIGDPGKARFVGLFSTVPFIIRFDPREGGLTATYFGRWATRTGLTGPWSAPVNMQIACSEESEKQLGAEGVLAPFTRTSRKSARRRAG